MVRQILITVVHIEMLRRKVVVKKLFGGTTVEQFFGVCDEQAAIA